MKKHGKVHDTMTHKSLWRLEPMNRPSEAHAADAVEIVSGEIVRRVSLPRVDYAVLCQRNEWLDTHSGEEPSAHDLCGFTTETLHAALRRLSVAGLIPPPNETALQ